MPLYHDDLHFRLSPYNIWSGHHLNGTTPEMINPRRVRALEGIAGAMLQLGKFSFKIGGCPFTACSDMSSLELYRLFQALLIKESRSSHPVCTLGKTISPRTLVVISGRTPNSSS